jgi:hypothetical protein
MCGGWGGMVARGRWTFDICIISGEARRAAWAHGEGPTRRPRNHPHRGPGLFQRRGVGRCAAVCDKRLLRTQYKPPTLTTALIRGSLPQCIAALRTRRSLWRCLVAQLGSRPECDSTLTLDYVIYVGRQRRSRAAQSNLVLRGLAPRLPARVNASNVLDTKCTSRLRPKVTLTLSQTS